VQAPQLQHDQEQEADDRAARDEQVLPLLSQAHAAQGNEVTVKVNVVIWSFGHLVNSIEQSMTRSPDDQMTTFTFREGQ
jgi:hypothetical protein